MGISIATLLELVPVSVRNLPFELAINVVFLQKVGIVCFMAFTGNMFDSAVANLIEFFDPLQSLRISRSFKLAVGSLLMPLGKRLQSEGIEGFNRKRALIELQHVVDIPTGSAAAALQRDRGGGVQVQYAGCIVK